MWRSVDIKICCWKESKDLSKLTKEELKGKLESHEQRMAERAAGKSKSDMTL